MQNENDFGELLAWREEMNRRRRAQLQEDASRSQARVQFLSEKIGRLRATKSWAASKSIPLDQQQRGFAKHKHSSPSREAISHHMPTYGRNFEAAAIDADSLGDNHHAENFNSHIIASDSEYARKHRQHTHVGDGDHQKNISDDDASSDDDTHLFLFVNGGDTGEFQDMRVNLAHTI